VEARGLRDRPCLGFELLAGAPPFTGNQGAVRNGHLNQVPPEAPCGDIVLKDLIGRLLEKDPNKRPQDARAVLERLHRALAARSPLQESIARGLHGHAAEQASTAASRSAARDAEEARQGLIVQAEADLGDIVNDALSELQAVEPDATLSERRTSGSSFVAAPTITLAVRGVVLQIVLWEGATPNPPVPGDTMVLAGCVMISNPRFKEDLNAANLVYEKDGDRFIWRIYKFHSSAFIQPDKYRAFGPYGRTHGLGTQKFFDPQERSYMLHPVTHVWSKTVTPLTAETLLGLFQEAVDLKQPDPRTGIW
jgi:hypothetical protein